MATKRFTAPVTIHLFFIKDHQILLLRRFNTGYEDGITLLSPVIWMAERPLNKLPFAKQRKKPEYI
jgi:hypothetical protein